MRNDLAGKTILIVEGSLISVLELQEAVSELEARPILARNVNAAFDLLNRLKIDGLIVDHGLHNEAFDLCSECQTRRIPYICCTAPHRLQGLAARRDDAGHAVWRLAHIMARSEEPAGHTPIERLQRELRAD